MDRLTPVVSGKQLLRGFVLLVIAVVAAYFIAPRVVGSEWSGFATTLFATIPLLGWVFAVFFKKRKLEQSIESQQLNVVGTDLIVRERLPFGFVTASSEGIGLTYYPMTEVLVPWSDIKAFTFCQFGKVLQHQAFDPEVNPPKLRSWSKPVVILQTALPDFPKLPIVFDNSSAAIRWIKILEARRAPEQGFIRNVPPWRKRFSAFEMTASIVSVFGAAISLGINTSPLPHNSENTFFLIFIGGQLVSAVSSMFGSARESGSLAILQTLRPEVDKDNCHRFAPIHLEAGAIWITEEFNALERIPIESIVSATVKLKKSDWMSRSLFKPAPLDQAELTLELDRDHDKTRIFQMTKSGAELSIAALLAEHPDLKILGTPKTPEALQVTEGSNKESLT